MAPDVKNGWTDCAQIWYTDRGQLVGCRASQLGAPNAVPREQGSPSCSLVCRPKGRITGHKLVHFAGSDLILTSVLVEDNLGQGCPVAWLLSSRENTNTITAFLKGLKQAILDAGLPFPAPRTFMSDCADVYYSAWLRVCDAAQRPPLKLLCSFHVVRAWRNKLSTIKVFENVLWPGLGNKTSAIIELLAYTISATPFRGDSIGLRSKPPPVVKAKKYCKYANC